MYCKNCGKQISNDSVYCQFCGTPQNNDTNESLKRILRTENFNRLSSLTTRQKIWIGVYIIWVLINLVFVLIRFHPDAINYFFPFESARFIDPLPKFDFVYYDFSEFIVYAVLIPALIYGIHFLRKNYLNQK